MNNRKINKFIKDLKNLPVYEFEGENYIKVDEFMKVWQVMLNVSNNRTNIN